MLVYFGSSRKTDECPDRPHWVVEGGGVDEMKVGLNLNTFAATDDLRSILNLTKGFGIRNVEFWSTNCESSAESVSKYAYAGMDTDKAKALLAEFGMNVCCFTFGGGLDPEFVMDRKRFSDEFVRAVELASEFGATIVNHYSDAITPSGIVDLEMLHEYWEGALNRAEELDITLALENEALDATKSPDNMLEIIRSFNSSSFKTNFDATNYYQSGNEPFPYAYEILKKHIVYVHIKNGCKYNAQYCTDPEWVGGPLSGTFAGTSIYYLEAGTGAVNIDGLLDRLDSDGYDGYCVLEPHTTRQNAIDCIQKEVAYLRKKSYISV